MERAPGGLGETVRELADHVGSVLERTCRPVVDLEKSYERCRPIDVSRPGVGLLLDRRIPPDSISMTLWRTAEKVRNSLQCNAFHTFGEQNMRHTGWRPLVASYQSVVESGSIREERSPGELQSV